LGDDNYIFEKTFFKGRRGMVFRRDNIFVFVEADSMKNAKKLAHYAEKEILSSQ